MESAVRVHSGSGLVRGATAPAATAIAMIRGQSLPCTVLEVFRQEQTTRCFTSLLVRRKVASHTGKRQSVRSTAAAKSAWTMVTSTLPIVRMAATDVLARVGGAVAGRAKAVVAAEVARAVAMEVAMGEEVLAKAMGGWLETGEMAEVAAALRAQPMAVGRAVAAAVLAVMAAVMASLRAEAVAAVAALAVEKAVAVGAAAAVMALERAAAAAVEKVAVAAAVAAAMGVEMAAAAAVARAVVVVPAVPAGSWVRCHQMERG